MAQQGWWTLYSGQGGVGGSPDQGSWFTTNAQRAASHAGQGGKVVSVSVPDEVYQAGSKAAKSAGSGTSGDAILPFEWIKKAVPANVQRVILDLSGDVGKALEGFNGLSILPKGLIQRMLQNPTGIPEG